MAPVTPPTVHAAPITDRSAWTGAQLLADRSWELSLDDQGRHHFDQALASVKGQGLADGTLRPLVTR